MAVYNKLVVFLPGTDYIVVVMYSYRFADKPFVGLVVVAITTQFDDLIAVQGEVESRSPTEVFCFNIYGV